MKILGGVIGAVLGFIAGIFAYEVLGLANKHDPIASGMIALLVFGPMGAIAGTVLGTKVAMMATGPRAARQPGDGVASAANGQSAAGKDAATGNAGLAKNSLKSLGIVFGGVVVAGVAYYVYAVATATPWLKPGGVVLQFEIRYPAGTVPPAAKDISFELQTDINTMPGEVHAARFRNDGDRPVIAGEVDLAFRKSNRQLEVKMPGRMDRTYQIRLGDKAPHTAELGRWELHPDGSEFRYRAKWPGRG